MTQVTRQLQVIKEIDDSKMLKIAFATSDRKTVNQHFGSAQSFTIYGITASEAHLLMVSEFEDLKQDGNEDKLVIKIELLKDCVAVFCRACGASAVRQLLACNIHPVKVTDGPDEIDTIIQSLQQELKDSPAGWLGKAVKQMQREQQPDRLDFMAEETWDE
ncbi:NifB/NifX family molybdenum-iron cluster-binding protein [Gynuella sp.]|uniref:NifB/NifX family molybdenum-iron cluster-binding protein n=1 Tax=Gynuella sp. TaxID=2969146 RepID=UPI003D10062B